jgi:hypothetical protein
MAAPAHVFIFSIGEFFTGHFYMVGFDASSSKVQWPVTSHCADFAGKVAGRGVT